MAFVAPLIAGAIGVGAVGEAIIGVGLAVATGLAARALAPKPSTSSNGGMRLSLRTEANAPRELVVGRAATAGTLIYTQVYGPNGNDNLQLVFLLADHECDGLETIYVNGSVVAWNSGTGAVTEFPGMKVTFHSGAAGQTADADLVANSGGRWTAADRGAGLCYVAVTISYSQTLYATGVPKFLFVMRGAKLYDVRKDSTAGGSGAHRWGTPTTYEWTANPVVIAYNYARGVWAGSQRLIGMGAPASALPAPIWIAEANICDEAVALAAGGTEARYRANGVISSGLTHRQVFADLTSACGGLFIETAGALKLRAGAARASVATITDDDLIEGAEIEISAKRPRSELVNAVFGSFADPAQMYESTALPPRLSPADEAADGGIRLEQHYPLDLVTSPTQGQRILEMLRRRGRHQLQVTIRLPASFCSVEAGDWVSWSSSRYGWSSTMFEVMVSTVEADKSIALALREISSAACAWTVGDQLDPQNPGTLPSGGPTLTTIVGLSVATLSVTSGSVTRPGLQATWTPVTDATVVSMRLQYRIAGDTVALDVSVLQPSAGSHTWISGVQAATTYEVRALPVCQPERATAWSAWTSSASATAGQTVTASLSALASSVAPDTVTPAMLSAQARFELALSSAVDGIQGSMQQQITDTITEMRIVAEHAAIARVLQADLATGIRVEQTIRQTGDEQLAQQITVIAASLASAQAGIITEQTARADGDSALASQLTTLTATVAAIDTTAAMAAVATEATTRATADSALSTQISTLTSTVNSNNSAVTSSIASEATTRSTADSALSTQISTLTSTVNSNNSTLTASVASEATARANGDNANASAINTVSTVVGSHSATISTHQTSIDGIRATWTVSLSAGYATGWAMLDGSGSVSTFGVAVNNFFVAQPGATGGAARQVFSIGNVAGTPSIGISGNMYLDGSIFARHLSVTSLDAICGTFGALTAGTITSPDGKLYISSVSGAARIRITA